MRSRHAHLLAAGLFVSSPAHAVSVHGLDHTALGAASVSAVSPPGSSSMQLHVANIGSSGQDGVSVALPECRAYALRARSLDGTPIVRERLDLFRFPSDATPVIRGSALRSGPDRVYSVQVPPGARLRVEVWDGGRLAYSGEVPAATTVTALSVPVAADTAKTIRYSAKQGKTGSAKRETLVDHEIGDAYDIQVGSVMVHGSRIVFEVETDGPAEPVGRADLRCATAVGSPPATLVVTGESVSSGAVARSPRGAHHDLLATIESGALHAPDAAPGSLAYGADGSGGGMSVRLNGLPPGEPVFDLRAISGDLDVQPLAVAGMTQTFASTVEVSDDSGLPPSLHTHSLSWTATSDSECDVTAATDIPLEEIELQVWLTGRPVGQPAAAGLGAHVQCSSLPTGFSQHADDQGIRSALRFAPGTVFLIGGIPQVGDEVVAKTNGDTAKRRRISDIRLVHPPGTPPGLWRLTGVRGGVSSGSGLAGGMEFGARGPRQSVSLLEPSPGNPAVTERRLPVRNLGSSGEDGVEVRLRGSSSISFDILENDSADEPDAMRLSLLRCPDGTCAAEVTLEMERGCCGGGGGGGGGSGGMSLRAGLPPGSYIAVRLGNGHMLPLASADLDGDGWVDCAPASPVAPRVSHVRSHWVSSHTQSMSVHFSEPVAITCDDGVHVVTELEFWRNPGGTTEGPAVEAPQLAVLTARPPAAPVLSGPGVCDLTLRPPGLHVSGADAHRADVGTPRGEYVVRSTWGRVLGEGEVVGEPGGGHSIWLKEKADTTRPRVIVRESPTLVSRSSGAGCPGFVIDRAPEPSGLVWSPRTNTSLRCGADLASGASDAFLHGLGLETGDASPPLLRYLSGAAGSGPAVVRVLAAGMPPVEVLADEASVSDEPTRFVAGGDLDGDGAPEIACMGFPPSTTVTVAGQSFPCDRLEFRPGAPGTDPVTAMRSAALVVESHPGGRAIFDARIAEIAPPGSTTSVTPGRPEAGTLVLRGLTPNPSRGDAQLRFALGTRARIRAEVLDIAGRAVAMLADGELAPGEHTLTWSGRTSRGVRAAAGLYLVRLSGDGLAARHARIIRLD